MMLTVRGPLLTGRRNHRPAVESLSSHLVDDCSWEPSDGPEGTRLGMKQTLVSEQSDGRVTSPGQSPALRASLWLNGSGLRSLSPAATSIHLHFHQPCTLLHFFLETTVAPNAASTSWLSPEQPCSKEGLPSCT